MSAIIDPIVNFGKVEVSTTYDASATTVVLATGEGAKLPEPSVDGEFHLVWWDSKNYPDPADDPNKEIVNVTARSSDTLTVERNQESTGASTKNTAGGEYKMLLSATKHTIDQIIAMIRNNVPFTDKTSVTVTHNLGVYPIVHVVDSSGNVFLPDVNHASVNAFTVTFAEQTTGVIIY